MHTPHRFPRLVPSLPCLVASAWTLAPLAAGAPAPWSRASGDLGAQRVVHGPLRVAGPLATEAAARAAARDVLRRFADDLGVHDGEIVPRDVHRAADLWSIEHEQEVQGLPVVGSRVDVLLGADGVLLEVRALRLVRSPIEAGFVVGAAEALERAASAVIASVAAERPGQGPGTADELELGSPRAVLFPSGVGESGFVVAWQVAVEDPRAYDGSWLVTIDGRSGETRAIERRTSCAVTGTVRGRGMASGPSTSGAPTLLPLANVRVSGSDPAALLLRLTANACGDSQAVISGDGLRVAFVSDCDGDPELWTVKTDGTGLAQLTSNGATERAPAISADGSRIAYVSDVDGDPEVFVVGSDGTNLVQITSNSVLDEDPSLSGDGSVVVWTSAAGGDREIHRSSTSAPAPVALTANSTRDDSPVISLDGTRIAWVGELDGDREIYAIDADGTNAVQLTSNTVEDGAPSIRGDGLLVVFESRLPKDHSQAPGDPSGGLAGGAHGAPGAARMSRMTPVPTSDWDLFAVAGDGTGLVRLTSSEADERAPALASGGGVLAYVTDEGGDGEIRLRDMVAGSTFVITSDSLDDSAPSLGSTGFRGVYTVADGDLEVATWNVLAPGAFTFAASDAAGLYSLPLPDGSTPDVRARLQGAWARVSDESPSSPDLAVSVATIAPSAGNDLTFQPAGSDELETAQVTAYLHTDRAHEGLAAILRRPPLSVAGLLAIDRPLLARVNIPEAVANAFYSFARQDTSYFVGAGVSRPNTAYDTVIEHEYGHFFDDMYGGVGTGNAHEGPLALSEGAADALAMYLSGTTTIAADWTGPGTWGRNYAVPVGAGGSKGRQLDGLDCPQPGGLPEVHAHGEAFGGFAAMLRSTVGPTIAENLIVGALLSDPPDMQGAVSTVFGLSAGPGFGGTGSPATSPLYDAICAAAAAHGFDCFPRPDHQSHGCTTAVCSVPPVHHVSSTEWLGTLVDFESGCEPLPNPDDDGVVVPPVLGNGTMAPLTFTLRINPALKTTGRYGDTLGATPAAAPYPRRLVYLNVWLLIDDLAGGHTVVKLLGTGSGSGISGPAGYAPDTLAYDPDAWTGTSLTVTYDVPVPFVPTQRPAIVRARLDYGEDCGKVPGAMSDPALVASGLCGPARFGEVEEYQVVMLGGPPGP